ncbi:hypothetical protein GGI15_002712 [Coemansia interrupta]|uniref:Tudor domain-containing protein n=1 Tax=Coemansia interrupta TaxID=1126814 RepID=A0A9W8LJJ1_9FUNG|nr:hypothetical protein GGI15_002712 [Coemansia interrupta]
MDASEVEIYATKLVEVELALATDPQNPELLTLKQEIEDLLALTSQLQSPTQNKQSEPEPEPEPLETPLREPHPRDTHAAAAAAKVWRIGDQCEAKYMADGKYYPARVIAVRGDNTYQVAFVGYGDMQESQAYDMRVPPASQDIIAKKSAAKNAPKDAAATAATTKTDSVIKGKVEKPKSKKSAGGSAASGQQAWLKFAKGSGSKKLKAKPINDRSIFKSPDAVTGRIGVANSGRGMTKNPGSSKM